MAAKTSIKQASSTTTWSPIVCQHWSLAFPHLHFSCHLAAGLCSKSSLFNSANFTATLPSPAELLPSPVDHEAHTDQVGFLPALPSSKASHCLSSAIALPTGLFAFLALNNKYAILRVMCHAHTLFVEPLLVAHISEQL